MLTVTLILKKFFNFMRHLLFIKRNYMTKTNLFLSISLSVLLIAVLSRCTKDSGKVPVLEVSKCDTITYTKHIKPIMEKYCTNCHGTPLSGGAPVYLDTYSSVKASGANGTLKKETIDDATMPYGGPPLSQSNQDLISCWLTNGMKE